MSSTGVYFCCNDLRRNALRGHATLNGIDFLEVVDHQALTADDRQRILLVHFVNQPAPASLTRANVLITGGERIRNIAVDTVAYDGDKLKVHVTPRGDFSTYTLRLVDPTTRKPLAGLDALLAEIEFSFKVECESDFDCRAVTICPPHSEPGPEINYLARDYATFRRLMLDRLSLLVPGWREHTPADFGVTLVELLAYVADHLSYRQDAIATEAYLGTARRRISVRRHARLVDYLLHDGCNARAFVHVRVNSSNVVLPAKTQLLTRVPGLPVLLEDHEVDLAVASGALVFETMHEVTLQHDHNFLDFYTWQSTDCCLPLGATSSTLIGHHPLLKKGTLLLLGERVGARTGKDADADRQRRHVVRLAEDAAPGTDPLANQNITGIRWDAADALPFPLCISTTITDEKGNQQPLGSVSIAIGNIVLADHGRSIEERLEPVPKAVLSRPAQDSGDPCAHPGDVDVLPRFRPRLSNGPVTQTGRTGPATADAPVPLALDGAAPASTLMHWSIANVLPHIELTLPDGAVWNVRRDLFESDSASPHFVSEVEEDGLATLRFGDDEYGRRPLAGSAFLARYRVGNGTGGNIGINAIAHIVSNDTGIDFPWNPVAGTGGVDPESLEHARQSAPAAFRVQERAVTEADYAEVTERHREVSRAAATFRWTGSWYTLFDSIDRSGGAEVDAAFETEIRRHVETYRVVGNDLEIDPPQFVSLELALTICVKAGYFRSDVAAVLRDVFTSGTRRDGRSGFFHPDNFTFGQPVPLSAIVAAAASVDGVDGVFVDAFRRQGSPVTDARDSGILELGRLEIARLENSRNFPEHGSLSLTMRGGA